MNPNPLHRFLAVGNNQDRRPRNRMVNERQRVIDAMTKEDWQNIADKANEQTQKSIHIRFNELTPNAQMRFTSQLQNETRHKTVKRLQTQKIIEILTATNPIIIRNYNAKFGEGDFSRYREKKLSCLIHNMNKRINQRQTPEQTQNMVNNIKYLINPNW